MYISGIVKYMIWPLFILVAWLIIWAGLKYYERRFPGNDQASGHAAGKNDEITDDNR